MKSFASITLALAAISTLSLASPTGVSGRGVAVSGFVERNMLGGADPADFNSAGPHHKGTRRHQRPAAKFARRRANKKRQDCEDDDSDDNNDDSGSNDSSYGSGTPSAAYPSSTPSYGSSGNGSSNGNKANQGTGDGSKSGYSASATPSSSGSKSSGSSSSGSTSSSGSSGSSGYDSSLPSGLQGTVIGTATYYFQGGAAGSCGTVAQDSDKVVAVSEPIMQSTSGALCGKTVQITNTDNGKSVTALVKDSCPGCVTTHLDLSQGAFDAIGAEAQGVLNIKFTIS